MTARLITIGISHYCEKARWALDRQRVPYVEEKHLPLLHYRATFGAGGGRTAPVLVDDGRVFPQSQEIVAHADEKRGDRPALVPQALRDDVLAWCKRCDDELGPHARRWGYAALLPDRALSLSIVGIGVPSWEMAVARATFPWMAGFLRRALKIDDAGVERSRKKMDALLRAVDERLADGRRYLCGDALTAADITFASLGAPLVLPPGHPTKQPDVEQVRAPFSDEIRAYRARPSGRHILRLYAEERAA